MARRSLLLFLWLTMASIITIMAYLALSACGVVVLGYRIGICASSDAIATLQDLQVRADQLERQLLLAPCNSTNKATAALDAPAGEQPRSTTKSGAPIVGTETVRPTPTVPPVTSRGAVSSGAVPARPRSGVPTPPPVDNVQGGNAPEPLPVNQSAAAPASGTGGDEQASPHQTPTSNFPQSGRCLAQAASSSIVFVLDRSNSMRIPLDADQTRVDQLEREMLNPDPKINRPAESEYEALYLQPGEKRIDRLKSAMTALAENAGPEANYTIVPFAGCDTPPTATTYSGSEREALIAAINDIKPGPATPLANAIGVAADVAKRSRAGTKIVLITDGMDTCSGDPCSAAQAAGTRAPINVIAFGDPGRNTCIAKATGGRMLRIDQARDLASALRDATGMGEDGDDCR